MDKRHAAVSHRSRPLIVAAAQGDSGSEKAAPAPDSATKPGNTVHGCRAAVIVAFVRYSDMTEGTAVTMRSFADNQAWTANTFSWPAGYPADASLSWTFYRTRNGTVVDEPLTARSWRFELTIGKRRAKETTVTLDNATC
jgi:hypothetical protein